MTIATAAAQITGLAISPLLVLVAIGLGDFFALGGFQAAPGTLPLHANPWLLGPCAAVLVLVGMKKFLSPAMPLPLRKLLDAAEYFEAKLSALVAAGVLLPTVVSAVAAATTFDTPAGAATASLGAAWGGYVLAIPAVLVLYGCVWIMFHMVDALVVLSPFAVVDAILVTTRLALLALIGAALLVSPYLACALCLPIIVVACLVAGWCVRLDLFVLAVAGDLLLRRSRHAHADRGPLRAFLAARGHGAPVRTMGHAEPLADGGIAFSYHPFFVLPAKRLVLASRRTVLVHGLVWSTLRDDAARRGLVSLPPRYQPHHEIVAQRFAAATREGAARRGFRGIRAAISAILSPDATPEAAGESTPPR